MCVRVPVRVVCVRVYVRKLHRSCTLVTAGGRRPTRGRDSVYYIISFMYINIYYYYLYFMRSRYHNIVASKGTSGGRVYLLPILRRQLV